MRWRWAVGLVVVVLVAAVVAGALLLSRGPGRLAAVPANQAPAPPVTVPDGSAPAPDGPLDPGPDRSGAPAPDPGGSTAPAPGPGASVPPPASTGGSSPPTPAPSPPVSSPPVSSPPVSSPPAGPSPGPGEDVAALGAVDCRRSDRLTVTSGEVEAALGHRYLVLGVTNCTDAPVGLPDRPDLSVRDATGEPLSTTFGPDSQHPTTEHELAPGTSAYLQLQWLVAPQSTLPTAGHELVVRLPPAPTATVRTQLDVDGLTEVDVHDWAPTVSEAVAQ